MKKLLSRFTVYTMIVFFVAYFAFFIAVHCAPTSFAEVNAFYLDFGFFVITAIALTMDDQKGESKR